MTPKPANSPQRRIQRLFRKTPTVAERVLALYGQPEFETWHSIGRALRLSRGSAWSLAHGLRQPDPRTLDLLTFAEKRRLLPQATANLYQLLGQEPVLPVSFSRAQARALRRKE